MGQQGVLGFDPGFVGVPVVCGCVRKSLVCVGGGNDGECVLD